MFSNKPLYDSTLKVISDTDPRSLVSTQGDHKKMFVFDVIIYECIFKK